jgi:hypothetical protein
MLVMLDEMVELASLGAIDPGRELSLSETESWSFSVLFGVANLDTPGVLTHLDAVAVRARSAGLDPFGRVNGAHCAGAPRSGWIVLGCS